MAPEQFAGRAVAASDLYGLGATLIYLLTGNFPGDLPSKEGIIEFEKVAGCSGNFSEWLRKMVEPLQENRFQSAVKALKNLENLSSITLSDYSQSFAKKDMIKKSAKQQITKSPNYRCSPHSVFGLLFQRPFRSSPGTVQCLQPIEA